MDYSAVNGVHGLYCCGWCTWIIVLWMVYMDYSAVDGLRGS
jgi:hypothetical protein